MGSQAGFSLLPRTAGYGKAPQTLQIKLLNELLLMGIHLLWATGHYVSTPDAECGPWRLPPLLQQRLQGLARSPEGEFLQLFAAAGRLSGLGGRNRCR